jgi:hypothetical protein
VCCVVRSVGGRKRRNGRRRRERLPLISRGKGIEGIWRKSQNECGKERVSANQQSRLISLLALSFSGVFWVERSKARVGLDCNCLGERRYLRHSREQANLRYHGEPRLFRSRRTGTALRAGGPHARTEPPKTRSKVDTFSSTPKGWMLLKV